MKKEDILKQLIQTESFTNNKAAKEMLQNAIQFVKKDKTKTTIGK